MKPSRLLAQSFVVFPVLLTLIGCGQANRSTQNTEPTPLRGRVIEALSYEGQFLKAPVIEHLDFGGAVLTTFTATLSIQGDKEVLRELFWESGKHSEIVLPDPKKCVPSMFGITSASAADTFELKFWAWDNTGKSTDCEDLIYAMVQKGFHIRLKEVKYADIGLVKNFEAKLKPVTP